MFAYPFFALTRQQLKTENNKQNIYTQYLMKSTFETIWLFFTGPSDLWNYSFYTPVYDFTRHGLRTTALFRRLLMWKFTRYNERTDGCQLLARWAKPQIIWTLKRKKSSKLMSIRKEVSRNSHVFLQIMIKWITFVEIFTFLQSLDLICPLV